MDKTPEQRIATLEYEIAEVSRLTGEQHRLFLNDLRSLSGRLKAVELPPVDTAQMANWKSWCKAMDAMMAGKSLDEIEAMEDQHPVHRLRALESQVEDFTMVNEALAIQLRSFIERPGFFRRLWRKVRG